MFNVTSCGIDETELAIQPLAGYPSDSWGLCSQRSSILETITTERSPSLTTGMLAAETPSMEAHMAAATPRRRGKARAFPIKLIEIN